MNWLKKLTKNWQTREYIMAGFFILSILISIFVSFNRVMVEQRKRQIELVVDYDDIEKLRAYTGVSMETIYRSLQKAGITSISLQEDTLNGLTARGKASWISGEDILNSSRIGMVHRLSTLIKTTIKPGFYYVMIDETEIYSRAYSSLVNELGRNRVKEVGWHVIEINGSAEDVGKIGLGFPARQMQVFKWYKFEVIPRLVSSYRLDDVSLGLKISKLKDAVDIKTVIFTGDAVLGYNTNINIVIDKMKDHKLNFGLIEFMEQKGAKTLAASLPEQTIGVHSIPSRVIKKIDKNVAIERYMLAATERGMKILYMHPFLRDTVSRDLLAYNEEYFSELKKKLEARGFEVVAIKEHVMEDFMAISLWQIIILSFGIAVALFVFIQQYYPDIPKGAGNLLIILFLIADILAIKYGVINAWRSVMALVIAIIFPTYAMITQLPTEDNRHVKKMKFSQDALLPILKVLGITLIGALLIIGLLSDSYYMLKISQFRGVKLAFIMPLMLVGFYYFLYPHKVNALRFLVKRFMQGQITVGYVAGIFTVFVFLGIYLLRSGNYHFPVLELEATVRRYLGAFMLVRPRTKEFLLGYPLIIFTFYNLGGVIRYNYRWVVYALATVIPVSVLNTFCHIHAPLWISAVRTINGLVLGLLLGMILVYLFKVLERLWKFIFF